MSFDGSSFVPAIRQDGSNEALGVHDLGHLSSFWMLVPEGITQVEFALAPVGWWTSVTMVKDFAFWSLASGGGGCAGSAGVRPFVTAGVPQLGTSSFFLALGDALPGAPAVLGLRLGGLESPRCALRLDSAPDALLLPSPAPGGPLAIVITGPSGEALLPIPLPAAPAFSGLALYAQWGVVDPAGTFASGGLAASLTPLRRIVLQ